MHIISMLSICSAPGEKARGKLLLGALLSHPSIKLPDHVSHPPMSPLLPPLVIYTPVSMT